MFDTVSLSLLIKVFLVLICLPHKVLLLSNGRVGYHHILDHGRDEWQDEQSALTSSPEEAGLFSLRKYIASHFFVWLGFLFVCLIYFFSFFSKFASVYPTECRMNFLIFIHYHDSSDEPTHLPSALYCNSKLCTILLCSK